MLKLLPIFAIAVSLAYAQPEGSFERTLHVTGTVDLDLTTDAGGIVVIPGAPGAVRIRGILRASGDWMERGDVKGRIRELEAHPPIDQSGNTIRVAVHDHTLLKGLAMRLEVEVPRETRLRARADSGGIEVRGIQGPIDCKTDSGGIHAAEIDRDVRAAADSGGIHIRRVNAPVYAHTDSGGIEALEIAGSVDASADSGGITISQTAPGFVKARVDSGGVRVTLVGSAGYDVRASAESGRIHADGVSVSGTFSPHEMNGKLRGGGPLVDLHADSGDVEIR